MDPAAAVRAAIRAGGGAPSKSPAQNTRATRHAARALGVAGRTLALLALAQTPARADEFSDFRIPANRALLWTAGFSSGAQGSDSHSSGSDLRSGLAGAAVSSKFDWLSDSDPARTTFAVGFSVRGDRFGSKEEVHQDQQSPTYDLNTDQLTSLMRESWQLSVSDRRYPWAAPLGFGASASLSGNYLQTWSSDDLQSLFTQPGNTFETLTSSYSERWNYRTAAIVSASAGWGRVRNATGIYDALVLEERLLETAALTRPLSAAARQKLADVMYLRGTVGTVRERPGRFLWQEIERVLSEDGALREGGLDAYSLLRATEPHLGRTGPLAPDGVPVSPVPRQAGYFVGLRLEDAHQHIVERRDQGTSTETILNGTSQGTFYSTSSSAVDQSSDLVEGGLEGQVRRPFGRRWQLDGSVLALAGVRAESDNLRADARLNLFWLVADRWTATGGATYLWFDEKRTDGPTAGDRWLWAFNFVIDYYLEDRAAIELAVGQQQQWVRGDESLAFPAQQHLYGRTTSVSLGLTYRFSGWMGAPGYFVEPGATP